MLALTNLQPLLVGGVLVRKQWTCPTQVEESDDQPDRTSFDDQHRGTWYSLLDSLTEEIGEMQYSWPAEAIRYFDEAAYERDERHSYTVLARNRGVLALR